MPDSISIDQVSYLAMVMKFVRETSNSPRFVLVLHFSFDILPCFSNLVKPIVRLFHDGFEHNRDEGAI